ncbi:hypothetical protein EIP86_007163 [Pleurotus ostreatoroseus]|nr:hypothetical protein EIP86_007163 [Pleurotus ostreatoroseus]
MTHKAGAHPVIPYTENLAPYGATKFAVRGFTEAAAKEWAKYGIRVNGASYLAWCCRNTVLTTIAAMNANAAYGPGIVDTPMWDHIDRELAKIENISVGEAKAKRVKREILLGRIQEPEDVAKLVSWLVSDEAEYLTGQTIKTCGGASL